MPASPWPPATWATLKALQAGDSSGRVFAAIKTSLDDLPNPNVPQIMLLVLGQNGEWTSHVFGRVRDHHSRPIVMLDEEHRELYMFATAPTGGGTIHYKRTDLDNISFPSGMGTPYIQSATDTHIDDATSTKQNLRSATGLVVLASDSESKYYLHNAVDLDGGVPPPPPPMSCTILGTSADETISGTSGDDVICGGEGSDTIEGLGGNDILRGEGGADKLIGGVGNDTERGGLGNDQMIGSGGADFLYGEGGDDTVNSKDGVSGNDTLSGGTGTDTKVTDVTEKSIVGFP